MEQLYIYCLGTVIVSGSGMRGVWSHRVERKNLQGKAVYNMEIDSIGQNASVL